MTDPLVSLLQSEPCKPLLARLRKRAENGSSLSGTLQMAELTRAQRGAISDLTGQTSRGRRMQVDVSALDELVRSTGRFESLLQLVEQALGHPIENKRAAKQQQAAQWDKLWDWAAGRAADHSSRQRWLDDMRQTGWLKAGSRRDRQVAKRMLDAAFSLLDRLPADGVPLPVFAAVHAGDAHALDPDRFLGRLVCRAVAVVQGLSAPSKRSDWRRVWESVGIVPDELSATVLSLNLPAAGDSLTDQTLRTHAELGAPCRLTFRHLRLYAPTIEPPGESPLFVCENPSIVAAAADRLGPNSRALVCVEGQPNLAALGLLRLATVAGWRLTYHGDFDWGGIRIANQIYQQFGFRPWRFDAASYRTSEGRRRRLRPPTAEAAWDADLSAAMEADGRALEEEQVLEQLLTDLERQAAVGSSEIE